MMELLMGLVGLYLMCVIGGFALRILGGILKYVVLLPLLFVVGAVFFGGAALFVWALPLLLAVGLGGLALGAVGKLLGTTL